LQEGRENANIDAGLEFIWRISIGTMYVDSVRIENFRTYRNAEIDLLHPDRTASDMKPRFPADILYPNINLVLGNNGMGKSAFLKAIALGCLGPTVRDSGIFPYRAQVESTGQAPHHAVHPLDHQVGLHCPSPRPRAKGNQSACSVRIDRRADLESLRFLERRPGSKAWNSIFRDDVDAFFFVGYGASRRTEERSNVDQAARRRKGSLRAQRVRSLFEDDATLIPLSFWLPAYSKDHPDRAVEVVDLMNAVTGPDHYRFTGELERDEYLFQRQDQLVPFPALSDGYRAFFGWMSDLLYHVCQSAPPGTPLVKNRGIVMIDEIDLHLHPSWQMEILPSLSRSMPNLQFIVTSHSPLVAGSLQWINLIALEQGDSQSSVLLRKEVAVHGLDADQVLLTPFFSLNTTRTGTRAARLNELRDRARKGDREAAMNVMEELSRGSEQSTLDNPLADPRQEPLAAPPPAEPLPRTSAERARPAKRKKATKRKRAKT
jgi:hypothetical protein